MLADHKEVHAKRRSALNVEDHDKEEQEQDNAAEECDEIEDKESNIQLNSQQEFYNSSDKTAHSDNRLFLNAKMASK